MKISMALDLVSLVNHNCYYLILLNTTSDTCTLESMNWGLQVDMVILDFLKSSIKISHKQLSTKISYYDIKDDTLLWINKFLCRFLQQVVVDGESSQLSRLG